MGKSVLPADRVFTRPSSGGTHQFRRTH